LRGSDQGHDGDRVSLELSPYDLTKGRITYRHKWVPGSVAACWSASTWIYSVGGCGAIAWKCWHGPDRDRDLWQGCVMCAAPRYV